MTDNGQHFTIYDAFDTLILVYGIGVNVVHVYGQDIVTLQDPNNNIYDIFEVW
jgi:hypothetical protein